MIASRDDLSALHSAEKEKINAISEALAFLRTEIADHGKNNAMLVATIATRGGVSAGPPETLFDGGWALDGGFAIRPDGKSLLMIRKGPEAIPTRIDLVLGWFSELARRAAGR